MNDPLTLNVILRKNMIGNFWLTVPCISNVGRYVTPWAALTLVTRLFFDYYYTMRISSSSSFFSTCSFPDSCSYDLCDFMAATIPLKNGTCPSFFLDHKIPCRCPLTPFKVRHLHCLRSFTVAQPWLVYD
jgi:hypothetical protein